MRVALTGATGVVGRALVAGLRERGDEVSVLSRDPDRARATLGAAIEAHAWADPSAGPPPPEAIAGCDAVVNLLGEPVARRWSSEAKRKIRDSRVLGTRHLVAALGEADPRPRTLVSGSATGYYGPRGDERLDESAPPGRDFLAQVCVSWEAEARQAEKLGVRVVMPRTGVVLADGGGALEKMLPPFKLGIGGPVAGGRQWVPWVHLDDAIGAILFALDNDEVDGPINVTAPEPVTNRELSRALGRVLHRPSFAPVPGLALRALYGEMAQVVVTGNRAVPTGLLRLGYRFRRPELEPALRQATGRS